MNVFEQVTNEVPGNEEKALKIWLAASPSQTLRKIVAGLMKREMIEAANTAMAIEPNNAFGEKADASLKRAQRYQTFLEVFQEIIDEKKSFSVITVK